MGGTFVSDTGGTFVSDTGGTFIVILSIEDVNASKFWRKQIIQIFKIDESDFNKHHTSAIRTNSSAKDKKFVEDIDEAIKEAKNIELKYPLQKD